MLVILHHLCQCAFGCIGHVHIATKLVSKFCELPNHCLMLPRLHELDILERHDELMLPGAGIVPLLLSCLEHTKGRPFQAFCVLSAVVADDMSKQAALAQMHGILYVSKMLKPITAEQEDSGVSPSGEAQNLPHASLAIVRNPILASLRPHHGWSLSGIC
jgi:hypothetical protein